MILVLSALLILEYIITDVLKAIRADPEEDESEDNKD
jgi:hypothetical protein